MKYLKAMFVGAALLAGSFAFGGSQDAVALTDSQMDQVTGEYLRIELIWTGNTYTVGRYILTGGSEHGELIYIGGPCDSYGPNGHQSVW